MGQLRAIEFCPETVEKIEQLRRLEPAGDVESREADDLDLVSALPNLARIRSGIRVAIRITIGVAS